MLRSLCKPMTILLLMTGTWSYLIGTWTHANGSQTSTLLIVGDSLSVGYGVPQGQEWAQIIQQKIVASGFDYNVVNASISGDTTASGKSRLPSLLQEYKPQWLLLELGANDGLRGLSLTEMENNLATMIQAAQASGAKVILLGMKIPPNYGKKYTDRFEQVFETMAQRYDIPLMPFFLATVATKEELMQADRLHPNAKAQPQVAENVWTFLKPYLSR